LQGQPGAGRKLVEAELPALELIDVGPDHSFAQVTLLGLLGIHLFHLGLIKQARVRLEQAYARAVQLGQPMGTMVAIWLDALMQIRLGDTDRVSRLAGEMRALVEKTQLGQGRAAGNWFKGWAEARAGKPQEGYRQIHDAFEENSLAGMLAGGSEVLGYAAEALLLAGDHDGAQRELEQAFQIADKHGERVYLPQLYLIEGAIARARGKQAAALASVRRAIEEARSQEAPWLELLSLVELCGHEGAKTKDRQALAALVDRLPEAAETDAVTRARALIRSGARVAAT
jgi:tetratricopeptide (TPR) repeat protein